MRCRSRPGRLFPFVVPTETQPTPIQPPARPYTHVSSHIRARQSSIGIGVPVKMGQK